MYTEILIWSVARVLNSKPQEAFDDHDYDVSEHAMSFLRATSRMQPNQKPHSDRPLASAQFDRVSIPAQNRNLPNVHGPEQIQTQASPCADRGGKAVFRRTGANELRQTSFFRCALAVRTDIRLLQGTLFSQTWSGSLYLT
jgi:hypothetical protein